MISQELGRALVFSGPLIAAFVCLVLTILDRTQEKHPARRAVLLRMISTYSVLIFVALGFVLHAIAPEVFIYYVPMFIPLAMSGYALKYSLIRTMTRTGEPKRTPLWAHFIIPAAMFVAMTVTVAVIPQETLYNVVYKKHVNSVWEYILISVYVVYSIVYPMVALVKISKYRRKTKGSNVIFQYRRTLGLLSWIQIFDMLILPFSVAGLMLGVGFVLDNVYVWLLMVSPPIIIYIIVCCNLLSDNYVIIDPDDPKIVELPDELIDMPRLSRERVEHYMSTKRPYLNPSFRITDMSEDLFTNRAYISAFINSEYGVNFNRFINDYRLAEVEKLREEADKRGLRPSTMQIILNSGFNSYRSYLRAKELYSNNEIEERDP